MVLVSNTLHQIKRWSLSFRERYLSLRKEFNDLFVELFFLYILRKRFHFFLTQNSIYFTIIMYLCTRNRQLLVNKANKYLIINKFV